MSMSSTVFVLFALFAVATGQSTSDPTSLHDGYGFARQSSRHLSQTEEARVRTFSQLESAVEDLRNGGRIVIEASTLRVTNTLRITQSNLQIIGGGDNSTTLRCPEDGGIFEVRGDGTRMENLRFINCQSSSAISIEGTRSGGQMEFNGVIFEDNILSTPYLNGAGLVINRCPNGRSCEELRVLMEDCHFLRNQAEVGGAVFAEDVSLELRNCTFEGNEGRIRGGAVSISRNSSSLLIDNCQFQNNRVVQPLMVPFQFFGDPNGAPLETIPYWTFQFPNGAGGAVFVDTISQTEISNSTFRSNLAQAGGALGISINIYAPNNDRTRAYSIDILDSIFQSNGADYTEAYERGVISGALNTDLNLGGGIYLASSSAQLSLNIARTVMRSNWARLGGALHLVTHPQTQPTIRDCIFTSNQAAEAGGGLLVRNTGQLNIFSSNLTGNSALLGGGLMLTNNAQLRLGGLSGIQNRQGTPCVFEGNSASAGGGLMCSGCGPVTLQDPVFLENTAEDRGGGFFALDSDSDIGITQGIFQNNRANRGGAIAAEVTANIRISTASPILRVLFLNNSAVDGGGAVFTRANHQRENRLRIRHAVFESNSVLGSNASTGCSAGGGALCLLLDSIPRSAVADYLIEETRLEGNRALVGGGAYIRVQDISWLDGGEGRSRCPEARPTTEPCRSFRFGNVNITGNEAQFGAGGLFINDPESLALFCASVIPFERQSLLQVTNRVLQRDNRRLDFQQDLFCTRIHNNSVQEGEFGPDVGTAVYSLSVIDPVDASISNHTGGARILPPCEESDGSCTSNRSLGIQVSVLDAFQQRISGGIRDSELAVVLISDAIIGEQRYNAEEGMININNTIGVGIDADSNIQIQSTQNRTLSVGLDFTTRACLPGENASVFSCQECLPNQYSFSAQFGCRDCEDKAICPGKAALVPVEGYWHSTPFSPQFHECIVREACEYRNRLQTLTQYYSNLQSMAAELVQLDAFVAGTRTQPDYEDYQQCAEGYRGVLCGSCEEGYGHFPGGECVECPAGRSGSSLLAVLISLWTAVFLGLNIFTTFNSTQRQILMVLCQNTDGSPSTLETRSLSQRGQVPGTNEKMHEDRIIAMIKVTELLKIFINYLQVTSVALSINLNWQELIKALLSVQGLVMGVASGSYLVPLDCSFDDSSSGENSSGVPNSIKVLWLQVTFPLVLLVFFCLLCGTYLWIYRSKNRMEDSISFKSYFTVIAIVVVFFSYVKVTSELMRTVNCIGVDDEDEVHEYQQYAILTKKRVWAEDTQLDCFEGDHTLTGVFGILGLVFFSLMVILFILFWLPFNSHRLKEPEFIAQYGFIYQGYKEEWYLTSWEAIIAIRKALIAAAVVFAFPLGPNLQGVCALGVIILAIAVHFVFSPFKRFKGHPNVPPYAAHWFRRFGFQRIANWWVLLNNSISLNAVESASLLMSMIVFYSGILFNDENSSEGGKHTMAAFTFLVNVSFVCYVLYRLYSGAHVAVNLSCEQLKQIAPSLDIPDGNGVFAFLKKSYLILINRNVLDNHMRSITMKPSPLREHI